jgi:hypothetical protein
LPFIRAAAAVKVRRLWCVAEGLKGSKKKKKKKKWQKKEKENFGLDPSSDSPISVQQGSFFF